MDSELDPTGGQGDWFAQNRPPADPPPSPTVGTPDNPVYGNTGTPADPWGQMPGDPSYGYPPGTDPYWDKPGGMANAPKPTPTPNPNGGGDGGGNGGGGGIPNQSGGPPNPSGFPSPTPPDLVPPPVFQAPDPLAPWTGKWNAPNPNDVLNDPTFQASLNQGIQAIQRSAAAKGTLLTGGTIRGVNDLGVSKANDFYQGVYNNNLNTYNQGRTDFLTNEANRYQSQLTNNQSKYNADFANWSGKYGQQQGIFGDQQSNQMNNYGIASSYFNQGLQQQAQNFNMFNTTDMNNFLKNYDLAQLGRPTAPNLA